MYDIALLVIYFIAYSTLGWVAEFVYMLVVQHKVKRPDFLWMPISPPYGLGSLAIIMIIAPYVTNPFYVFLLSIVLTTVIEFISHFLIEKLFHIQLWNYDHKPFNLQGRIALSNSIAFGALGLALVYVIHPLFSGAVSLLPATVVIIVASTLLALFIIDAASATGTLVRLRNSKVAGSLGEALDYMHGQVERLMALDASPMRLLGQLRAALAKLHRANIRRLKREYPGARFRR